MHTLLDKLLLNSIQGMLVFSEEYLDKLEEINTEKPQLERIATVVIGLKIALDGLTKTYDDSTTNIK